MWRDIWQIGKRVCLQILYAFLPIALFGCIVELFDVPLGWALLIFLLIMVMEAIWFIKCVLPTMGDSLAKTLYAVNITTDEEDLIRQSRQLWGKGDVKGALQLLRQYRVENAKLLRPWIMEAGLLNDMQRYDESVSILQEGLDSRRWRKEDKALFLYKIAGIYDTMLNEPDKAYRYYHMAAERYPHTAYGRAAKNKL